MVKVSFQSPPHIPNYPDYGLGWSLTEADGSLMSTDEDEWVQPETINAKIDRLEKRIVELTEKVEELMKFFWH